MHKPQVKRQSFGRYDRLQIGKSTYRYVRRDEKGDHVLQLAVEGLLEDDFRRLSDAKIAELQRRGSFKVEPAYYSRALDELRARNDNSNLLGLSEEQVRTIFWKMEWCIRFHKEQQESASIKPLTRSNEDLASFIEGERDSINRWYIRRFKEPRKLGRPVVVGTDDDDNAIREAKPYDYPSPSGLRNWLKRYDDAGARMSAFTTNYHRCGNRQQLDPELDFLINQCVKKYADQNRPAKSDILDKVETELKSLNRNRRVQGLSSLRLVAPSTVYRRIAKLEPFFVETGRYGKDRALRKYLLVGQGVQVDLPLERVEIDDWEADLHTLLASTRLWSQMTKAQRQSIPRVRCTVTAAIDCRTRCIVGLNVSESAPSTPGAKAALRTITQDKTNLAKYAECGATWQMHGRPDTIFFDGGPVFSAEFQEAVRSCGVDPSRPDPDPRQRGTIEAFFRYLRRSCRYFTGRTFSNVVEKAEYPSEQLASVTVEEFRKFVIRFVVDIYHNRKHRGLAGETPFACWERLTSQHGLPATITAAQRLTAFGFKKNNVRLDNQGVMHLGVSYSSPALGSLLLKLGIGAKVNLVIDPEDLGQVFVQVPKKFVEALRTSFPIDSHGEFLEVAAVDARFSGVTLAERLAGNQGVRDYVAGAAKKGETYRLSAHEALGASGIRAAKRIGLPTSQLTDSQYQRIVEQFLIKSEQSLNQSRSFEEAAEPSQDDIGEIVAGSRQGRSSTRSSAEPVQRPSPQKTAHPQDEGLPSSYNINRGDDE